MVWNKKSLNTERTSTVSKDSRNDVAYPRKK